MSKANIGSAASEIEERVRREREWHNELAQNEEDSRRLIDRMTEPFYSKTYLWRDVFDRYDVRGKDVLDYGCGYGDFTHMLALRGARVTAIDVSDERVKAADKRLHDEGLEATFHAMDAHRLDFADHSFDYLFGNGILHHLDWDVALKEVRRVLRPGGRAFFTEPLARHPGLRAFRALTPKARSPDEYPLTIKKIEAAREYFSDVQHKEHFVFSPFAAPTLLASRRVGRGIIARLQRLDAWALARTGWLREFAWVSVIEMRG